MAAERKKFLLFRILMVVGFALGLVLLYQTVSTYNYVSGEMMMQEAERDSQRKVNSLVGAVRSAQTLEVEPIKTILDEYLEDWTQQVAWIRILDGVGTPVAIAGFAPVDPVPADELPRAFATQQPLPVRQDSAVGEVFVSIRSFRTVPVGPPPTAGSGERRSITPPGRGTVPSFGGRGSSTSRGVRRPPGFGLSWNVELALYPDSVSGSFASLRRNLIIGVSASLSLMAALVLIAVRAPNYLRGQQIERELDLARRVQADLLPSAETISPLVDFSAECISAWQVGGDFCDVIPVGENRTALVIGDVSGKGISAALLMALIHGAIHSVSWTRSSQDHVNASRQINTLLCKKTATERFTSLFWGYFDPNRSSIQYINAGHLPPLLLRMRNNELEVHPLESGGPVMGLLPEADFQQGEQHVEAGDLLVAFSDGVIEATNVEGEDFGDKRVVSIARELWSLSASDIRNAIHGRLKEFTGDVPVEDDQTLIVIRFKHSAAVEPEMRTTAVSRA